MSDKEPRTSESSEDFEPGFCHVRSSIDKCAVAKFGMKDICKGTGVRVLPFCFSIIGTSLRYLYGVLQLLPCTVVLIKQCVLLCGGEEVWLQEF